VTMPHERGGHGKMAEGGGDQRASTSTPHVFISYASQDAAVAAALVEALERHDITCWIAPRDVTPGSHYADGIMSAITGAKALVLVLSGSALASKHVGKEVERASSKGRPIIAIRTDTAPLTPAFEYFLSESQWIDLGAKGLAAVAVKLVEAVKSQAGSTVPTDPVAERMVAGRSTNVPLRRWMITAVVAVFAIFLGYLVVDKFWLSKRATSERPIAAVTPAATPAAPAISDKSIAVLPFVDMSENKDQEYFADGMAEEVLDQLVKVPQLKVISRTSSFQYKGKTTDIRAIGAALGARYLVEGSVRKSGNKLRITAELIDAQDGAQRWADRYDRDIGDVLKVQDEIAISVVRALEVSVGAFELPTRTAVRVPAAYDAYLRARHAADQFNKKGFEEAVDDYREALRLDPTFARAAAALALLQTNLGIWGYLPVDTAFSEARASAELAIRLDGTLAMPHAVLALRHVLYDWDWQAARRELAKATALQSRDPITEFAAANLSAAEGNWDEAISHLNASLALDPFMAATYYVLSTTLIRAGRLDQAEAAIRRAMQISPSYVWAHYQLGNVLLLRGKLTDALAVFQEEPDPEAHLYGLALANYALGHRQASDAALEQLTKLAAADWAFGIGTVHAYRGEVDQAFTWFERAYAQKDVDMSLLKGDPISAKIWPDPRYKAFLRKMNLPE
jgi:adenylate cyclase